MMENPLLTGQLKKTAQKSLSFCNNQILPPGGIIILNRPNMLQQVKKSLLFRIALPMVIIISLSFRGMFSSVFIAQTSEGYAAAINQAGTLRMQSYRIASSLVHFSATDTPYSVETTRQLVNEFEKRLQSSRIHNVVSKEASPSILRAYKSG